MPSADARPQAQRRHEIELKAAELAETRRKAREEALVWQEELSNRQVEEEARKAQIAEKKSKRREAGDIESGDEDRKERKKRKKTTKQSRKIRSKSEISTDEEARGVEDREASMTPEGMEEDDAEARKRRQADQLAKLKAKVSTRSISSRHQRMSEAC